MNLINKIILDMVILMIERIWDNLEKVVDKNNPYTLCFKYDDENIFYIEPVFLLKLSGIQQFANERFMDVIEEMKRIVFKNHKVVFIGEEDEEITQVDDAIYLTIQDVCNPIHVFVEDKSRGSDYGD